jgi:Na+-driven multidrug efflux pump
MGKALYATLCAISRQGLFLLPALFVFTRVFEGGLLGIQISLPVADLLSFAMTVPLAARVLRELGSREAAFRD